MGASPSLRIAREPQAPQYKGVLQLCLQTFPPTTVRNVTLSNHLFSQTPRPFAQRVLQLFPEHIPFQSVVAIIYVFMAAPRHTRATLVVDLYLPGKTLVSKDDIRRFFFELTAETNSVIDLNALLNDFERSVRAPHTSAETLINFLAGTIKADRFPNSPIFRWLCEGGPLPPHGPPLLDPGRTVPDLLGIWDVCPVAPPKRQRGRPRILASYATLVSLCNFRERRTAQLRVIAELLRKPRHASAPLAPELLVDILEPSITRALLAPLVERLPASQDAFFIALALTSHESNEAKLAFVSHLLRPPAELVDETFVAPFIDALVSFVEHIQQAVVVTGSPSDVRAELRTELDMQGAPFAYVDFEQRVLHSARVSQYFDLITSATDALLGGKPTSIETEFSVFNALYKAHNIATTRPGDSVVLLPVAWYHTWSHAVNARARETVPPIDFLPLLDPASGLLLRNDLTPNETMPLHTEVFAALDAWYSHDGPVVERPVYLTATGETAVDYSPLPLSVFLHERGELAPPSSPGLSRVRSPTPHSPAGSDVLLVSQHSTIDALHRLLCTRFNCPLNRTRLLKWKPTGATPVPAAARTVGEVFAASDVVCLDAAPADSVARTTPMASDPRAELCAGDVGLLNTGNTCYMNAVLQVVAHTPLLVDYFLSPMVSIDAVPGATGAAARAFSDFVRRLWRAHDGDAFAPEGIRDALVAASGMFEGEEQQDAMEYLSVLLDTLHLGVNRNDGQHVRYRETPDGDAEFVLRERWRVYRENNDSIVSETFSFIIKDTVECATCGEVSVSAEPTTFVCVPLPTERYRVVEFVVVPMDGQLPIKYALRCTHDQTVGACLPELSELCGIDVAHLLCVDAPGSTVVDILRDSTPIRNVTSPVRAYEVERYPTVFAEHKCLNTVVTRTVKRRSEMLSNKMAREPRNSIEVELRRSIRDIVTIPQKSVTPFSATTWAMRSGDVVPVICLHRLVTPNTIYFFNKNAVQTVARPFVFTLGRDMLTVACVYRAVLAHLRLVFRAPDASLCALNVEYELAKGYDRLPFALSVTNFDGKTCFLCSWDTGCSGCPLTDEILQTYDYRRFTFTIAVDWKADSSLKFDQSIADVVIEHPSVRTLSEALVRPAELAECFQEFREAERLPLDAGWVCERCKAARAAHKRMEVHSLPQYLGVVIKRFVNNGKRWVKCTTDVHFPVDGLAARSFLDPTVDDAGVVYDLLAVVNHHGSLSNGHYTTYCRTAPGRWVKFDDRSVTRVHDPRRVVTPDAYILLYERRSGPVEEIRRRFGITDKRELLDGFSCRVV